MKKRPYIDFSIFDLEDIVSSDSFDKKQEKAVLAELSHRKTRRAKNLKIQIEGAENNFIAPTIAENSLEKEDTESHKELLKQKKQASKPTSQVVDEGQQIHPAVDSDINNDFIYDPKDRPSVENKPTEILRAWTALEVLSPQTFKNPEDIVGGDKKLVFRFDQKDLPWVGDPEKSRKSTRLYYYVILGTIHMSSASEVLMRVFGDSRPDRPTIKDRAVLAVITVDKFGRPVETDSIAISSFGWGFGKIRNGDLAELSDWPEAEKGLTAGLEKIIIRNGDDGDILSLDTNVIQNGFRWLVDAIGLRANEVEGPSFLLRKYQWYVLQNDPEPPLLNSFFINDLSNALHQVANNTSGSALRAYIGIDKHESHDDVLKDEGVIESISRPSLIPPGRWTMDGRYPLSLLQQASINTLLSKESGDVLQGINGPPGTGKTTLLRDIVVGVLLERARELIKYDDPETAFTHAGQMKVGGAFVHLYHMDKQVRGHELLVVSSNNKAVENVSRELPMLGAVDKSLPQPRYFRVTSDALSGEEGDTWGLISAVLGNATNRSNFRKLFWDDDVGLKNYLRVASTGQPVVIQDTNPDDGKPFTRDPKVVTGDCPPLGKKKALQSWNKARKKFKNALVNSEQLIDTLQGGKDSYERIPELNKSLEMIEDDIQLCKKLHAQLNLDLKNVSERVLNIGNKYNTAKMQQDDGRSNKPGFFSRLFITKTWKEWKVVQVELKLQEKMIKGEHFYVLQQKDQAEKKIMDNKKDISELEIKKENVELRIHDQEEIVTTARELAGGLFADSEFWEKERGLLHKSSPWLGKAVQHARDEVFVATIELQRAFIDVAAKPLRHNLTALMQIFLGRKLKPKLQDIVPELWSSLFLVVPVISTTFASIERMIGDLPNEYLGWLLVDEAGQAVPQAAVGSIMRSKRVVVVGDPLQIEPVVTLPNNLTNEVCLQFGVDPELWSAPNSSVQMVADTYSRYGTELEQDIGSMWIGSPLLVHRRCEEPMFSISNAVAYNNLMVSAVNERKSEIRNVIGPSQWFDVQSRGEDKWSKDEGDYVMDLLKRLIYSGVEAPDIYVITPFRVVAQKMRAQLIRERAVFLDHITDEPWGWVGNRVGTVHTFQGKAAEAVIFLLGAPNQEQNGARAWAGGRPNLLNVAVSRAKSALYIVGNRSLWSEVGVFKLLNRYLHCSSDS